MSPPETCQSERRQMVMVRWPEMFEIWKLATHRNCIHNELRSLRGRVLFQTPDPHLPALKLVEVQAMALADMIPSPAMFPDFHTLISFFPSSKRRLYRREAISLSSAFLQPKDAHISAFVKSEKLKIYAKDGDPRMIQARSPRFNLVFGLFTKAIEHSLYHLMDPLMMQKGIQLPMVAKGRNLRQRATCLRSMWDLLDTPVVISLDLSRWDAHVHVEMIKVMHQFYRRAMNHPLLEDLLQHQLHNRGRTENKLKYQVKGSVMSGDMTTALGNCTAVIAITLALRQMICDSALLSECSTSETTFVGVASETKSADLQSFQHRIKQLLTIHPVARRAIVRSGVPFLIFDDGDDHVLLCEKSISPLMFELLPKWWTMLGHDLKVEGVVEQFHQILFCQHKPHLSQRGWVMMPSPLKVLATATVVSSSHKNKIPTYLRTVWEARWQLHYDQPILGPLFLRLKGIYKQADLMTGVERARTLAGVDHLMLMSLRDVQDAQPTEITPEQRIMAWEQWGLTPDQQILLESAKVPKVPPICRLPRERAFKGESLEVFPG
nr:MAG: RNA-dependent RNA polymerase [Wufeng shrew nodamuvirus 1]